MAAFLAVLSVAFLRLLLAYRHTKRIMDSNDQLGKELDAQKKNNYRLEQQNKMQKEMIESLQEGFEQISSGNDISFLKAKATCARVQMKATSEMDDDQLRVWIENQIWEKRLFCIPDLDIKSMARELGITQKAIKRLLKNSKYDRLYDYLTEKRIAYACRLLKEQPHWTVEAVSKDAGFISRTTFQEAFKKHIGITPAQYRELSD